MILRGTALPRSCEDPNVMSSRPATDLTKGFMDRDTIFICHATPEDNDFARWLGSRLTGHGYKVWADVLALKGGAPSWVVIESALRSTASKVVFAVSSHSVDATRTGVRNELSVADATGKLLQDSDFIIPVRIDETPFSALPIQVHQRFGLEFADDWGKGLLQLLDTLQTADVPRITGIATDEFEKWRDAIVRTSTLVKTTSEPVLTNLLQIASLPSHIAFYESPHEIESVASALRGAGIPFCLYYRLILSFADWETISASLPSRMTVKVRAKVALKDFLSGTLTDVTAPRVNDARNTATALLRQHIERHLEQRGLQRFDTSSGTALCFPRGLIAGDKVSYLAASGRRTTKNVVGRSERHRVYWHLAFKLNVVLNEPPLIRLKPFICFSEDGKHLITDAKRCAALRRRMCRSWWNPHWRQLQQAFCAFLSGEKETIAIALDGSERLVLSAVAIQLEAVRSMPDDLKYADDEPDDPIETNEPDEQDEFPELDGVDQ